MAKISILSISLFSSTLLNFLKSWNGDLYVKLQFEAKKTMISHDSIFENANKPKIFNLFYVFNPWKTKFEIFFNAIFLLFSLCV